MSSFTLRATFALLLVLLVVLDPAAGGAYHHHASKVRFQDYSAAAFAGAKREGKPIFMLISAVWCYWCNSFDKNTLETDEVSSYLNQYYVSVFVDHDRRMDVTRKYVRGLPMIVFFDPDARIRQSFAGVLKKEDFLSVLTRVEREARTAMAKREPPEPPEPGLLPVSRQSYDQLLRGLGKLLEERADNIHGGFGRGDKHPHGRLLVFLLERYEATRDRRYLTMVEKSLAAVVRRIYDPIEGGFFRYAGGREWREPHFEKMLSVNASLLVALNRAYHVTKNPLYKEAATGTLSYILKLLYDATVGVFHNSQSADPDYYRLPREERGGAPKPPVNRDVVAASNAEAALAFLAVGGAEGRQDLKEMALRAIDFTRLRLLTDKGVYHLYAQAAGKGQLRGQLEANAWVARAFLEAHQRTGKAVYREAAEQMLRYSVAELFDRQRGAFVDGKNPDEAAFKIVALRASEFPLEANALMAETLLLAHRRTGRAEYQEVAKRVLASMGGRLQAILHAEDEPSGANLDGAATLLRAYGLLFGSP